MIKKYILPALISSAFVTAGWMTWHISIEWHDALHALHKQEQDNGQ